ncbi:ribonuclease Z [Thalassorhabdus alkalitolerans]|uniref:Ribonuclease Z n=1 Tax=Thalassorhabdus alkalitolerans TaxID=2282697 RepID=A0ABW0YP79_9BACI|nr:ribonuclease Z [Thalassobacillus sp. C254]
MEIHFLGTGAGVPSKQRNGSATALRFLSGQKGAWLFDCGEATQHRLLDSTLRPPMFEAIFITHMHGDHIYGLPGFLGSRSFMGGTTPLTLYGPPGIKRFITISLEASGTYLNYPLFVNEVRAGEKIETDRGAVEVVKLDHTVLSFGYRFTEPARRGRVRKEYLVKKGLPPGPLYKQLQEKKDVVTEDGTVVRWKDALEPDRPGRVISIAGDTKPSKGSRTLAENAEVLIHEGTFSENLKDHAGQFGHSTAKEAAIIARDGKAKHLILTHISPRYEKELEILREEAAREFSNISVAYDGFVYKVK